MENTAYTIKEHIILREDETEGILFDAETCTTFFLNETGVYIWKLLLNNTSANKIVDIFLEEFDVERTDAEADITQILDSLDAAGFIVKA